MNRLLHLGLAALVATFLAAPAPAKNTASSKSSKAAAHSNKGGATKGLERAEQVQTTSKADAHRGFSVARGVEKAEGKQATHRAPKPHR